MRRILGLVMVVLVGIGCGADPEPRETDPGNNGSSGVERDYCEEFGWYGDGKCDDFCKLEDPDCGGGPLNNGTIGPEPTEPTEPMEPPVLACEEDEPGWRRDYIAYGDECQLVDFGCVDGWVPFDNECGCGCEEPQNTGPVEPTCDYLWEQGDPIWVEEDPAVCATIRFTCEDGQESFNDECGCGCIEPWNGGPLACLEDSDAVMRYGDPMECTLLDFVCEEGWTYFDDDCGCGCRLVCSDDFECPNGYCGSSLPGDIDSLPVDEPMCIFPNCDDGTDVLCDSIPPVCGYGDTAAVVNGCYECLDARTCGPSMGP